MPRHRSTRRSAWPLLALLALAPTRAPASDYETPPVLEAKKILPAKLQRGKGFHVAERVPTDGLTTEFVIQSEVGDFPARGSRILELREREIVAIQKLRAMDDSKVFTNALKGTAERPIKAAVHMVENPSETLKGLPDGVGRFFDRVSTGTARAYDAVASAQSAGDGAAAVATKGLEATRDVLGYEQEKRNLAKRLGVDPYTSNQELAEALDHVAYVAFAGRLGVNTLISVAVPGSLIITGTTATNNIVYDTPRGDLVVKVEKRIAELLVKGPVMARETDESLVVPAPVDFVSWTERVARFADREDLTAPKRTILLTGQMTPRAKLELQGRGWIPKEKTPL